VFRERMGYEFRDGSRLERRVDGLQVKVNVMWGSHWREKALAAWLSVGNVYSNQLMRSFCPLL
jgi:hypothetical protein